MNKFDEKTKDTYRLFGDCGKCGKEKFFLARIIIDTVGTHVVSPSHYCGPCRKELRVTLQTHAN